MNSDAMLLDWEAQHYLKKIISQKLTLDQKFQVRSILHCNENVIPTSQTQRVQLNLIVSEKRAAFVGQVTCKNPFACPCCSARVMSKYAGEIADSMDAMKAKGYKAFLLTLTIPHLRFQKCKEVTDLLYLTWRAAFANCFSKRKTADGEKPRYMGPFHRWARSGELQHYVRAMEYTWGQNGWHPHFHCVFFVKAELFDACTARTFEAELNTAWIAYFRRVTMKYWQKNSLYGDDTTRQEIMSRLCQFTSQQVAVNIARQKNGQAVPFASSDYVAGFGAEDELAGAHKQKKAHHNGHYTPYQILTNAMDFDKNSKDGINTWADLYLEFLLQVTRKPVHHRVNFSKTGLKAEMTQWRNQKGMREELRKKKEEDTVAIASFSKSAWRKICQLNRHQPYCWAILAFTQMQEWELLAHWLAKEGIEFTAYGDFKAFVEKSEKLFETSIAG